MRPRSPLLLYLVAARDNPCVAAWIAVLDRHRLPATTPVSTQDWWWVFNELHDDHLVSDHDWEEMLATHARATEYRTTAPTLDPLEISRAMKALEILRQSSWGKSPSEDLSDLPDRSLKHIPSPAPKEVSMKLFEEPQLPQSLQTTTSRGLTAEPHGSALPERSTLAAGGLLERSSLFEAPNPRPISAFERSLERTNDRITDAFEPVKPVGGLPCVDPRSYSETGSLNTQHLCCGVSMKLEQVGGDLEQEPVSFEAPDETPVLEFTFHCRCEVCGAEFHFSVSKPQSRD